MFADYPRRGFIRDISARLKRRAAPPDVAPAQVDTGSQVCALAWSRGVDELVSTHGYSLNQICIWRRPGLAERVSLTGHSRRVLYLAISPDDTITTGAGDETLRFWSCFPGSRRGRGVVDSVWGLR